MRAFISRLCPLRVQGQQRSHLIQAEHLCEAVDFENEIISTRVLSRDKINPNLDAFLNSDQLGHV